MFHNNNRAVIRKLAKNSLAANRSRNVFILLAVALTTFMIGAVFSVGMGLIASIEKEQTRHVGSVAHAALGNPTPEQLYKAGTLDYVEKVGFGMRIGFLRETPMTEQIDVNLIYMDEAQWKDIQSPAFTDIVGGPPQNADEIMASRYVLDKLGITEPAIGMEVPLHFTTDGGANIHEKPFRLSGFFTSHMQVTTGTWQYILVASEMVYQYEKPLDPQSALNFIFKDGSRTNEFVDRLKEDLQLTDNQAILPSPVYSLSLEARLSSFAAMLVLVALFILTGYLLIYNVLYISVSRDIRFFGLLKTVGTTPKQIRRVIIAQVLRLCVVGIPIGLVLAVLVSFAAVPAVVLGSGLETGAVISFSPVIFIGASFFALVTALVGAISPANKASGISPIEAVRFTEKSRRTKTARAASVQGKPLKMAVRNILRERKRAVVVLASLFLGLTTFLSVISIISSMDVESYISLYYPTDFMLENMAYSRKGDFRTQVLDEKILQMVRTLPGADIKEMTTSTFGEMTYTSALDAYLDDFMQRQAQYGGTMPKEELAGNFIGIISGLDAAAVEKLNENRETPIDLDAFVRGEIVLVATDTPALFDGVTMLETEMVDVEGTKTANTGKTISARIGGFVPVSYKYIGEYIAPTIFISNTIWETLGQEPLIRSVYFDVSDEYEAQANEAMQMLTHSNADIDVVSKIEGRKNFEDGKIILTVLGGGLALILALIGVMNFINVMFVNVMARRREFAIMQSVGMTGKMLRKMLRYEGVLYAVATLVLVATVGNGIAYGLFRLFQTRAAYGVFQYPAVPLTVLSLAVFTVCLVVPELAYRVLSRATIVERLREAE